MLLLLLLSIDGQLILAIVNMLLVIRMISIFLYNRRVECESGLVDVDIDI